MLRSLVTAQIRWYMTFLGALLHSPAPAHTPGLISWRFLVTMKVYIADSLLRALSKLTFGTVDALTASYA
jgi:hypothetical protein